MNRKEWFVVVGILIVMIVLIFLGYKDVQRQQQLKYKSNPISLQLDTHLPRWFS